MEKSIERVVPLFRPNQQIESEPEVPVGLPPTAAPRTLSHAAAKAIDLSNQPKVWFLIGAGGSGKTMLARWLGWQMANAGRAALLAALGPQNRSLAGWFEGVQQPETSDGIRTTRWLRDLLIFLTEQKHSSVLDFGGGDTALAKLIEDAPDLADVLMAGGVTPVACYLIGPRIDDLASLASFEAADFQPRATLLLLNEGRVDSALSREEAFARVLQHSALRAARKRGAVLIWMPRLEPEVAQEIEGKRLSFGQARDGQVPAGQSFAPITGLKRSMVRRWLDRMDQAFAPVTSWLP